jgi:uncharacterized protein
MYLRKQDFNGVGNESAFLWGARQTGKSTLLQHLYPNAIYFDLLKNDEFERFQRNPSLLREILANHTTGQLVIIDEIQRIPGLLYEIQWLMFNTDNRFILSGSSPRKILRSGGNLLGGRAVRYELYPLVYPEIHDFDLAKALNNGLLPRHYISNDATRLHSAYIGSYLRDEIQAEANIRNIASFTRFLEVAAFSNGEVVNFTNIASDCGVSSPTIKSYFQILEDTLTGRFLPAYQKKPKRRIIQSPKFYYFDLGVANHLLKRGKIESGSENFGKAFEHFIYQEIYAHSAYSGSDYPLSYWRTVSQIEIDFVLGNNQVAIEIKSTNMVSERHLKGLKAFAEEYNTDKLILVSTDPYPRMIGNISLLPWNIFLEKLWAGDIIS